MKVLLLAAGRSIRLKPIDDKNFLKFLGKPLIWHQIKQVFQAGLKDLIVVGGKHNLSKLRKLAVEAMKEMRGLTVRIIEQKDLETGMAGAVLAAEKQISAGPVMVVSANDVVDAEAFSLLLRAARDERLDGAMIGYKVKSYFPGGYLKVRPGGLISGIVEKPGKGKEPSKMVNLVLHYHRDPLKLVEALKKEKSVRDDRYEMALDTLMKAGVRYKAVPYSGFWQPVKYPWDILKLMNHFLDTLPEKGRRGRNVSVSKSATVRGKVFLDDNARVLENAVIAGPAYIGKNTVVATGALVRGSQVGDNCVVGFCSEVARSFLGDGVWTHTNYIGDSIIGNNCSFGAGTVTGNLRLDEGNISVMIRGEKTDSGTDKFGLVTGDNVRCGINTSFMPGVKIGNNCFVGAGIIMTRDLEDNKYAYGKTEIIVRDNMAKTDPKKREQMKNKI